MAEFHGEYFAPPTHINGRKVNKLGVLARQQAVARKAGDTTAVSELTMEYMATVEDLLVMCVRPEDVERFDALCDAKGATDEQMMTFVAETVSEHASGRPTSRSSDSSAGPASASPSSEDDSSSRVIARKEAEGRPDLAHLILVTSEQRSA